MSRPGFVVLPISDDGAHYQNQDTTEIVQTIQESLHRKTHPEEYKEPEHHGLLKEIIDHKDSLYKYISWEDPTHTFGSYIGALILLFGAHYLPLTQTVLKAGITTLGVVSISEFASRQFSRNSFSARLRPEEYKKIPEPILNDTLKDIHDLIQYAVVHAQRIFFGQDLDKTFAAFLGLAALYGLIQFVPPFWLAVIGLTSIYIAPLVASPRGRAAAHDVSVRAQELANTGAEKGKIIAQNGKAKAGELSSKAQQTAYDAKGSIQNIAQSGKQTLQDAGDHVQNLAQSGKQTVQDAGDHVQNFAQSGKQTVQDAGDHVQNLAQSGRQTAADHSARARDTASDVSSSAADHVRKLPQTGENAINGAPDAASSAFGNAKQYISNSLPDTAANGTSTKATQPSSNTAETAKQRVPNGVSDQVNPLADKNRFISNSTIESVRQTEPGSHGPNHPTSNYSRDGIPSLPAYSGGNEIGSDPASIYKYTVPSDAV